jgi:hypothetical protein
MPEKRFYFSIIEFMKLLRKRIPIKKGCLERQPFYNSKMPYNYKADLTVLTILAAIL